MNGPEIPRHWRLKKQRYALVGDMCPNCNQKMFPPRDVCLFCGAIIYRLKQVVISSNDLEEKNDSVV